MNCNRPWILGLAALAACSGPQPAKPTPAAPTERPAAKPAEAAARKMVTAATAPNSMYTANGIQSLIDGRMGTDSFEDIEWMGWWYEDKPFEATIDLGKVTPIQSLGVHTLTASEAWIFFPRKVEFELSTDGKTFTPAGAVKPAKAYLDMETPLAKVLKVTGLKGSARFIRVRAQRYGELPKWHLAHGGADGYEGQAWLFIDEILVNPK